jgi:hypothetical protein
MDLGNAPESARHSESSRTDAGRQRVIAEDARIWRTWNFAAHGPRDTPADVTESLITELPRLRYKIKLRALALSELVSLQLASGVDDCFKVFDSHGDIGASPGGPDGLFYCDTRYLAHPPPALVVGDRRQCNQLHCRSRIRN